MLEDHLLRLPPRDTGGNALSLHLKSHPSPNSRFSPLLLLHGATFGAALFDLPKPGYSLMAAIADEGRAVYALDVRGYGNSGGGRVLEETPDRNPPFADVDAAVEDIDTAVEAICGRHHVEKLDVIGFSWGSITAARYAGTRPDRVARLGLYAPIYADVRPIWHTVAGAKDAADDGRWLGAYRLISAASVVDRWDADLSGHDKSHFRDDTIPTLLFETVAALDPHAMLRKPPAFRCPNGALKDLMQIYNGRRLFDPARLTMPVLLVRGEHDLTSTDADARRLLHLLTSRVKKYRVISPGSHFLCLERNRAILYDELVGFLAAVETFDEQA